MVSEHDVHPALARVVERGGAADAKLLLSTGLAGADVTTLLLAAMSDRAAELTPSDVLAQYRRDRFVAPADVDAIALARLNLRSLELLAPDFTPITPAPLVPLGSHSVFARVDQNNVVSTIRMTEVAADPTNQLALEAAVRRRRLVSADARSTEEVRLCAVQRVVRAQTFDEPRSRSHFSLLGTVMAGRGREDHGFERRALAEVVTGLSKVVAEFTDHAIVVRLTDFHGGFDKVMHEVIAQVRSDRISCTVDPRRKAGRGYYPNLCFKLSVVVDGEEVEVGDGGSVDWASVLLQSRKERLFIGGIGLERLVMVGTP